MAVIYITFQVWGILRRRIDKKKTLERIQKSLRRQKAYQNQLIAAQQEVGTGTDVVIVILIFGTIRVLSSVLEERKSFRAQNISKS